MAVTQVSVTIQTLFQCSPWVQAHVSYRYFTKDLRDNKDFLFSLCLTERKVLLSLHGFMFCFRASSREHDGYSKFSNLPCISRAVYRFHCAATGITITVWDPQSAQSCVTRCKYQKRIQIYSCNLLGSQIANFNKTTVNVLSMNCRSCSHHSCRVTRSSPTSSRLHVFPVQAAWQLTNAVMCLITESHCNEVLSWSKRMHR